VTLLARLLDFDSGHHRRWLQNVKASLASAPDPARLRAVRVRVR
jgi:hypothetical protein